MTVPKYAVLEKQAGQTPLQAIEAWRQTHPEFADVPATYAGRLDPMASGKLLVLLGNECKRKDRYIGLDKEYEVTMVLDLSTDTGDTLGLPDYQAMGTKPSIEKLKDALQRVVGPHSVPYPAFSSKTVNGIPLFQYALEGELGSISIPEHIETVHRIRLVHSEQISKEGLQERIESDLRLVPVSDEESKKLGSDFRQHLIRAAWKQLFDAVPDRTFTVFTIRVSCASGTYMRTLASRVAEALNTKAFALSIHRTKIGTFQKIRSFGFWSRTY